MEFRILGPLEVREGADLRQVAGAGQRALLAVLLLHANEVVSNDRLIDELWPDEPPGSGVAALRVRISELRKSLGPGAERLETTPPGYRLRLARGELDVDRFSDLVEEATRAEPLVAAEKLREALELWRGPALADFAYESFAQAAIVRLEDLRLTAFEQRIEADLALGRHAELVAELEELIAAQPLRERLRGQLMLALYRSGRQAEALEAYRSARKALLEELGIEPSAPLRELEKAILRQDPELDLTRLPVPERSILAVARDAASLGPLLSLAEALARKPPKELILARVVADADELGAAAAGLQEQGAGLIARGVSARTAAFVSRMPAPDIVRIATEQDVDLVLVHGPDEPLADPMLERVLADAPCDVAIVTGARSSTGPVLVPFVGADHDWAAVEMAAWIAGASRTRLLLAGPREGVGGHDASRLLADVSLAVQRALGVVAEPLLLGSGPHSLLTVADGAGIVVVGLAERWREKGLGPVREMLASEARPPVVLVRSGLRPGGLAPNESLTRFTWSLRS
jgi:DNA-binding SARP family transcriptional activator